MQAQPVPFEALATADLTIDQRYRGGTAGTSADDPLGKLLPVGNQGGFRYSGSPMRGTVKLCVLYTSGAETDWPDRLNVETGAFEYFGDNRHPGSGLLETRRRGNLLLQDTFARSHEGRSHERQSRRICSSRRRTSAAVTSPSVGCWRRVRRGCRRRKSWSPSGGRPPDGGFRTTARTSLSWPSTG